MALLGFGSIGAFAVLESCRPYLVAHIILLLGFALYFAYRKREVVCENGTCRIESALGLDGATVWLAAILATGAIAFATFDQTDSKKNSYGSDSDMSTGKEGYSPAPSQHSRTASGIECMLDHDRSVKGVDIHLEGVEKS